MSGAGCHNERKEDVLINYNTVSVLIKYKLVGYNKKMKNNNIPLEEYN